MENLEKNLVKAMISTERLALLRKSGLIYSHNNNIKHWLSTKSLITETSLKERLKYEGLSEEEFSYSIKKLDDNELNILFHSLQKSEWYILFQNIMHNFENSDAKVHEQGIKDYNISYLLRPYIYYFESFIDEIIKKYNNFKIEDKAKKEILEKFLLSIAKFYSKVFVLELNTKKDNGELKGENSEERFKYFVSNYYRTKDQLLEFYYKYPVFTRLTIEKMQYLIEFLSEAFERLDQCYGEIVNELFLNKNLTNITSVSFSEGDSHQKGKSVIIYEFESKYKLVYKPRNLEIVESYNQFVEWINTSSGLLDLAKMNGLYYKNFSFEKFIEYKECKNQQEVTNYYKRFGQLIATSYLLCGNDFHLENLIAYGEYPVLIDLETLIQSRNSLSFEDRASVVIKEDLQINSVINTCLLPIIAFNDNVEKKGIDISALNGKEQKLPYKILAPTNLNTDNLKYEYIEYTRPGSNNLPKYKNKEINFLNYVDYIVEGFENMMKFFLLKKDNLISNNSELNTFKGVISRNVLKPTNKYASLLDFSTHPNYAIDMLKREKLLENMWAYPYKNKAVIKFEYQDMMFDDIPIFFSYTDSMNIISSDNTNINNYFEKSGFNTMMERIEGLDYKEFLKQRSIMLVSFGKYKDVIEKYKGNRDFLRSSNKMYNVLNEARKIGDIILQKAIFSVDKKGISWGDIVMTHDGNWEVTSINESLYSGIGGVGYFLYELYYITNDIKYYEGYKKAMKEAIGESKFSLNISGYTGAISLFFPILNEFVKSGDSEYLEFIDENILFLEKALTEKTEVINGIDWISGYAGLIPHILNAYDCLKNDNYLQLAIKLGNQLINNLDIENWAAVGLGHGATGIALALIRLNVYKPFPDFLEIALNILEKERELLRKDDYKEEAKWCWGSTGMGIGKLEILKYYEDNDIWKDVEIAIKNISSIMKRGDCLCHGNMGDLELLNLFSRSDKNIKKTINRKLIDIMSMHEREGRFAVRQLPEFVSVDLFTGLSGIGYGLLRLYSPTTVSNVLTLSLNS